MVQKNLSIPTNPGGSANREAQRAIQLVKLAKSSKKVIEWQKKFSSARTRADVERVASGYDKSTVSADEDILIQLYKREAMKNTEGGKEQSGKPIWHPGKERVQSFLEKIGLTHSSKPTYTKGYFTNDAYGVGHALLRSWELGCCRI